MAFFLPLKIPSNQQAYYTPPPPTGASKTRRHCSKDMLVKGLNRKNFAQAARPVEVKGSKTQYYRSSNGAPLQPGRVL